MLGHVAPTPWDGDGRGQDAGGQSHHRGNGGSGGQGGVAGAKPLSQNAYKVNLARVAVKRALLEAAKQKGMNDGTPRSDAKSARTAAKSCAGRACSSKPSGIPPIQHSNDRSFWCQHTWNCLGPDGKIVDEFECSPAATATSNCRVDLTAGKKCIEGCAATQLRSGESGQRFDTSRGRTRIRSRTLRSVLCPVEETAP